MEVGTGAVKVTPAHSPVDFEIAKRHDLEIMNVINGEGKMVGDIPERFKGMNTVECSKALCEELDKKGLLVKIEDIKHEVAVCERCRTPIEPIISNQWYLDVSSLAKEALENIKEGKLKVFPNGQQKALIHFFEEIQPWCISRQLWWGQRIPVWYKGGKKKYDEEGTDIFLGENPPDNSGDWEAETDVFDTWFSSGQWPFSTLGGLEGEDFKKFYPTSMMIHARDILFWWSARMVMMGLYRTGKLPFADIFLTGMILAPDGSKMSKSKGNSVEPKEIFDKYGADSLRLWYYSDALPGSNAPVREEKIKGNRNFVNKIWNASRFILMNIKESEIEEVSMRIDTPIEETERIKKTKEHVKKVGEYIEKYQFNLGAEKIREFFWHEFCDIWIEEVKESINGEEAGSEKRIQYLSELLYFLKENLKIMHPFMPFVTESVWQELVKLGLAEGLLMSQQIMSR
jgi:valyl-tRNA synthetase